MCELLWVVQSLQEHVLPVHDEVSMTRQAVRHSRWLHSEEEAIKYAKDVERRGHKVLKIAEYKQTRTLCDPENQVQ